MQTKTLPPPASQPRHFATPQLRNFAPPTHLMILETRRDWLLRQAKKVGQQRKYIVAEKLYRDLLKEAPDTIDAWFGLAELTTDDAEREQCYAHILALEPENQEAQAVLRGEEIESMFIIPPEPEDDERADKKKKDAKDGNAEKGEKGKKKKKKKKKRILPLIRIHKLSSDGKIVVEGMQDEEEKSEGEEIDADHCYRHENIPTSLRCYDCDKLICIKCANKTPVGYICPDCKKELEDKYYTSEPMDYWIALGVSVPLSILVGVIVVIGSGMLGFWALLVMSAVGGFVGNLIGRIVKKAIGNRRGRYIPHLVATTVGLGVSWGFLYMLMIGNIIGMVVLGLYISVAGGAAFYWTK